MSMLRTRKALVPIVITVMFSVIIWIQACGGNGEVALFYADLPSQAWVTDFAPGDDVQNDFWFVEQDGSELVIKNLCTRTEQFRFTVQDSDTFTGDALDSRDGELKTVIGQIDKNHWEFAFEDDPSGRLFISDAIGDDYVCKLGKVTKYTLLSDNPLRGGGGNGMEHLRAAEGKRLYLSQEKEDKVELEQKNYTDSSKFPTTNESRKEVSRIECPGERISKTQIRELSEMPASGFSSVIYPGALLQGKFFTGNPTTDPPIRPELIPINIERGEGNITVTGLSINGPTGGKVIPNAGETSLLRGVQDKTFSILKKGVLSTASNYVYESQQTYSENHAKFLLGADGSYGQFSLGGNFSKKTKEETNLFLVSFKQTMYVVSFQVPQNPEDVFKLKDKFDDPQNQIGEDNPPLIVTDVFYGRRILMLAETSFSETEFETALNAGFSSIPKGLGTCGVVKTDPKDPKKALECSYGCMIDPQDPEKCTQLSSSDPTGDVKGKVGYTWGDIAKNTKITLVSYGGDADKNLRALFGSGTKQLDKELMDAISKNISSPELTKGDIKNALVPISFTVKYLLDGRTAAVAFNAEWDQRKCNIITRDPPRYELKLSNIDDDVKIFVSNPNDPDNKDTQSCVYRYNDPRKITTIKGERETIFDLTPYLPTDRGDNRIVRIQLGNEGCGRTGISWELLKDGTKVDERSFNEFSWNCDVSYIARLDITRSVGTHIKLLDDIFGYFAWSRLSYC